MTNNNWTTIECLWCGSPNFDIILGCCLACGAADKKTSQSQPIETIEKQNGGA